MIHLGALVHFKSPLELHAVAELVSVRLLGGGRFVVTEEYDEMPGLRLEKPPFLLHVTVAGDTPHYRFAAKTDIFLIGGDTSCTELVDLSDYFRATLSEIDQFEMTGD